MLGQATYQLGPLEVTGSVVTSFLVSGALVGLAYLARPRAELVGGREAAVEGLVASLDSAIEGIVGERHREVLPFVGTLWIFLVVANLVGLIPGLHSPTRDLSVTAALAVLSFLSVHWFGIRAVGTRKYLSHYLHPNPILLPFHLISEVSRTLALAVRLFGNVMSLEMTAVLILMVAGFLAPIPILMLHIIEALVQAYIFGVLTLV
ncbi:MAG: F0F1 ATP synthase subunit A, partial [Candidatus Eremiobacteraeota bacterium]|nr:F0F1 ATP synthase subunit A [Candidatus Eremiobacteraeota bacterium]